MLVASSLSARRRVSARREVYLADSGSYGRSSDAKRFRNNDRSTLVRTAPWSCTRPRRNLLYGLSWKKARALAWTTAAWTCRVTRCWRAAAARIWRCRDASSDATQSSQTQDRAFAAADGKAQRACATTLPAR